MIIFIASFIGAFLAALTGIRIPCHFRYGGAGDIPIGSPSYPESGDRPHCGCPFPGG